MKTAILLVYANKQDLKSALSSAEISDALGLTSLRKTIQWHIQACCALTGEGYTNMHTHMRAHTFLTTMASPHWPRLNEGLDWIVQRVGHGR
jgi:signal recognition particle receptor subunit beta